MAVAALGDRGEGVGAEYPDDPEHAGTLHLATEGGTRSDIEVLCTG